MRLKKVETGQGFKHRLILKTIRLLTGDAPDVVRTLFYRPKFFGDPYSQLVQAVMRGPSPWKVGERELFAAFVSKVNECRF
jgi:hypothetical protein